ncbi:MAG: redoxin domain-containing protein [Egibacteraceae bacterium]
MAHLRLGDTAPNFTAETTDGTIDFLDWKSGSWAVLFSHPADYTPVCTTELGTAARRSPDFAARDVKLIALSVEPIEDHPGWAPHIGEVGGTDLNFPIIADPDRTVAELYDMIHPGEGDASTVRSVFVIDPDDRIRLTAIQQHAHPIDVLADIRRTGDLPPQLDLAAVCGPSP